MQNREARNIETLDHIADTKQKTNSKSGAETQVGKIIKLGHWIPYQAAIRPSAQRH